MLAGKHVCKSLNFLLDCCRIKNTCSEKNTQSVSGGNYEGQKTQILQKPKNRWIEIIEKNQTWLWMIKFSQHNLLKWEESKNTTCCKHSQSIINIPKVKSVVHFYFTTGFIKHFKKKFWKDMKTLSENREKTATKQTNNKERSRGQHCSSLGCHHLGIQQLLSKCVCILAALLLMQFPVNATGKAIDVVQTFRALHSMWETSMEFLSPGFHLAQIWLLKPVGEWTTG